LIGWLSFFGDYDVRSIFSKLVSPAVILVVSGQLLAQPEIEPKDGRVTYVVTLTPNDAPKPVSRCYLLPEYAESITGNRVQMFLRCFMEQDNFFGRYESGSETPGTSWHCKTFRATESRTTAGGWGKGTRTTPPG